MLSHCNVIMVSCCDTVEGDILPIFYLCAEKLFCRNVLMPVMLRFHAVVGNQKNLHTNRVVCILNVIWPVL